MKPRILLILAFALTVSADPADLFLHYHTANDCVTVQRHRFARQRSKPGVAETGSLAEQMLADLDRWLKRHRVFELSGEALPSAPPDQLHWASLSVRCGKDVQVLTWDPSAPGPAVAAAVAELVSLLDAASGATATHTRQDDALPSEPAVDLEALQEARDLPFKGVVRSTTGWALLNFNPTDPGHANLRGLIAKAAAMAGENAASQGIFAARANEAGNRMQAFIQAALDQCGLETRTPLNSQGVAQATGYPDLEIVRPVPAYLELKTYSAATANTTQRSFYYSPSETPKVTKAALHLLLGFQMDRVTRDGRQAFVPVHWKLLTLQDLTVNLKIEYNQSNRGLYGPGAEDALLAEADVQ